MHDCVIEKTLTILCNMQTCSLLVNFCCTIEPTGSIMNKHTYCIVSLMYTSMFVADIAAYPDSVNVLEGVENDVRTPDKLIDGVSDTTDGCHMWLAPILPGIVGIF